MKGVGAPIRTREKAYTAVLRAGIFKESMGARNRGGIEFSYRPARLLSTLWSYE